jgi:hypothetical protein
VKENSKSGGGPFTQDTGAELARDPRHKDLVEKIEASIQAAGSEPIDAHEVILLLCKHDHPAGLIYLAYGRAWNSLLFNKLSSIREKTVLDMSLGKLLAIDYAGKEQDTWVITIQEGTMLKLLKGEWKTEEFNLWNRLVGPSVFRSNRSLYSRLHSDLSNTNFWTSPEHIRIA